MKISETVPTVEMTAFVSEMIMELEDRAARAKEEAQEAADAEYESDVERVEDLADAAGLLDALSEDHDFAGDVAWFRSEYGDSDERVTKLIGALNYCARKYQNK